jgi:uncharacterized membrane protein
VRTERGFDRIVNFTDATVAIAITLLVLPLVDVAGETTTAESVWTLLNDNAYAVFGFVLSFLVIWSTWVDHHRLLEFFAGYDSTMLRLHLVWLLTMASIPFTTKLITNEELYGHGATSVYVAVLLVSSLSLHLIGRHGRRHPELLHDRPEVRHWLAAPYPWTTSLTFALVLVVVLVFPAVGAWALLLLLVDGPVEAWVLRRRRGVRAASDG